MNEGLTALLLMIFSFLFVSGFYGMADGVTKSKKYCMVDQYGSQCILIEKADCQIRTRAQKYSMYWVGCNLGIEALKTHLWLFNERI